jgi:hypothetical protein
MLLLQQKTTTNDGLPPVVNRLLAPTVPPQTQPQTKGSFLKLNDLLQELINDFDFNAALEEDLGGGGGGGINDKIN